MLFTGVTDTEVGTTGACRRRCSAMQRISKGHVVVVVVVC